MTSTLLSHIASLPSDTIDWIWSESYHDRPITGWIRVKGKRYYYKLINDPLDWFSLYQVYRVPRTIRMTYMLRHRLWRQMVGWGHRDRRPDGPERFPRPRAGIEAYNAEYDRRFGNADLSLRIDEKENYSMCIGITDLREVRWLVDEKHDALDPETEALY